MRRSAPMIALLFAVAASASDWPAFRGPTGIGVSEQADLPLTWTPDKNLIWKVPLPSPSSTNGIMGPTSSSQNLHVVGGAPQPMLTSSGKTVEL